MPDNTDITSFVTQTKFPAAYFNFGLQEKKGTDFFNCGLVRRPDGLWLIARRSQWRQGLRFGMNDVVAFLLNGKNPVKMMQIQHQRRWPDEQFEDPRAIYHNGKTFISSCDFVWTSTGWTGAHQIICEISDDWHQINRFDPLYGNNGDNMGRNTGHEKNWIWFFHDNKPHLIYGGNPHVIVQFNDEFKVVDEYVTKTELPWKHGQIRGGTPPVLIGDEYWTFFHSSTDWIKPKRRYHMGAYAFEAKPPFRITQMTNVPIISGSQQDVWAEGKPLVVFPCGAVMEKGRWLVTLGINDLKCGWIEIPHDDLLIACAKKKPFSIKHWVADKMGLNNTGVIAYLPPPKFGHTDVFLKNIEENAPDSPVYYISDHDWPKAHHIPNPKEFYNNSDKIACYVFLHALEAAEKNGWERFIYLETDCRVNGKGWDKKMIKCLNGGQHNSIAGGNLAIFGLERADMPFKIIADRLIKEHGYERTGRPTTDTKILLQGTSNDKTASYVNGAPAIYSTGAVREIIGRGPIERLVDKMQSSDLSLGEICGSESSPAETLKRYVHIPEVMATAGEVIYPFHVRRTHLESGSCLAVHPIKNRWRPQPNTGATFYHCGDLGDILYSLKAIKLYGGGRLILGSKCYSKYPPRNPMTKEVFSLYEPLLKQQEYLTEIEYSEMWPQCTHDLNEFRTTWNERGETGLKSGETLVEAHCFQIGVEPFFNTDAWLVSEKKSIARIAVHRSFRYREENFPWASLVDHHKSEMIFVGLPDEYDDFVKSFGHIAYYKPLNFSDMAAVINGSEWAFINQSFPGSIAISLGKKIVLEEWKGSPDCTLNRPDFYTQHTLGSFKI